MKILITGGAGFIGANLVNRLYADGHALRVLDKLTPQIHGADPRNSPLRLQIEGKCEFIQGDVADQRQVDAALADCEAVIHLAAETGTGQSMYEVTKYCQTNVQGTAVLLEALAARRDNISRVVVASSRAIYGEGRYVLDDQYVYPVARVDGDLAVGKYEPRCVRTGRELRAVATDESSPVQPNSIYGLTKYAQEHMALLSCRALGIDAVALRFQNVFGPGQSLSNPYTGILSIFSTRIRNKREIEIYEDGLESRDFIFIDDVVESIVLALGRKEASGEVFGIGTGVPTTVLTVAQMLMSLYGIEVPLTVTGKYRVGDIRHNFADVEKADRLLGFKAKVPFHVGLSRFVDWVSQQPIQRDAYDESIDLLKKRGLFK